MSDWLLKVKEDFILNFVTADRWKSILSGLGTTLVITFFAAILGILLGFVIAGVRTTFEKNAEPLKQRGGAPLIILKILSAICTLYTTVIRGIPMVVQLLIMYFVIFASSQNSLMVATIAFGINSGAYVSEILRGGIMSIDNGQFEAGRSMGFSYFETMLYIIVPQVFKNVLPALLNEFIALLKETSVAGYVGIMDLTRAGNNIRGVTFSSFMPLIAVALIYLIIVSGLARFFGSIERRLRKNER